MSDRQEQFSGTSAVRPGQEIDAGRLAEWMQANVEGYAGPLSIEQFKGGQSNPTYKLITPGQNYVLRRKPPGQLLPSAHAVDREYKVITALFAQGFPVARTFGLCQGNRTELHGMSAFLHAAVICAAMESAISAGPVAPMARPAGPWIRARSSGPKPCAASRSSRPA